MKNKFIILTLCFTVLFSSLNINKMYAYERQNRFIDGGNISLPMLGVVSSLAVATGITLNGNDDIYDIGRLFYDKYKDNQEQINAVFNSCVSIGVNGVVTVGKDFIDICKDFFDTCFSDTASDINYNYSFGLPVYNTITSDIYNSSSLKINLKECLGSDFKVGCFTFDYISANNYDVYAYGQLVCSNFTLSDWTSQDPSVALFQYRTNRLAVIGQSGTYYGYSQMAWGYNDSLTFPYSGTYNPSGTLDTDRDLPVHVPGNLDSLVGSKPSDVLENPSYDLPLGGSVSLPGVNSPSIGVTDGFFAPSTDLPGVGNPSIPSEGIWATIKDFVVSLVVPSDAFWTDTFNGFRDNFSKNFPMLDMSKFDSLAVGGKPFPNLYAYGSKIVDGDVINSIVDWLRPIVAGFIMICLMFFNYRKIYKLIRNTEPFGGIAPGTSEFSTGLRDPDYRQTVREFRAYMAREGGGK